MPYRLSDSQRATFQEAGVLVLPNFYDVHTDIVPIQRGIHDVIGQVMQRHGSFDSRCAFRAEEFDQGYLDFIAADRSRGSDVYDAVKQIPAFMRLVAHPANEALFQGLRPASIPGLAAGGYGIRIDNPHETRFRAQWHQEYPAQLRSLDGLVFWSPLVPMTEELGPLQLCVASHRGGPVPVHVGGEAGSARSGAYALTLKDEEAVVARYPREAPLVSPGDLIVMDFLLLHASGHNQGSRSRWSMQFRYFNFGDPTGRRHGWKGSFAAGVDFRDVHPELCAGYQR